MEPLNNDRLITIKETGIILGGRSRASIYRDIADGRLPRPVKTGPNSVRFWHSEVMAAVLKFERS